MVCQLCCSKAGSIFNLSVKYLVDGKLELGHSFSQMPQLRDTACLAHILLASGSLELADYSMCLHRTAMTAAFCMSAIQLHVLLSHYLVQQLSHGQGPNVGLFSWQH